MLYIVSYNNGRHVNNIAIKHKFIADILTHLFRWSGFNADTFSIGK